MWYNSSFFQYAMKILIALVIIFLFVQLLPFIQPMIQFIEYLLTPLVLGLVLYYLFRPLVEKLTSLKVPFAISMIIVFLILGLIIGTFVTFFAPIIINAIQEATEAPTEKIEKVKSATYSILSIFNFNMYSYAEIQAIVASYLSSIQKYVFQNTFNIISTITRVAFVFVITPFSLFYFLKDDKTIYKWLIDAIPPNRQEQAERILQRVDEILLTFFHGQITIAFLVTLMTAIGLSILRIDNIVFLCFITFILSLIPYLGTLMAIIPPILQGLTMSYFMTFAAAGVMISVHLVEANLITPNVMMRRFNIHPLTVIFLIVGSISLFGVTGPLWITPFYVLIREMVAEGYEMYITKEKIAPK